MQFTILLHTLFLAQSIYATPQTLENTGNHEESRKHIHKAKLLSMQNHCASVRFHKTETDVTLFQIARELEVIKFAKTKKNLDLEFIRDTEDLTSEESTTAFLQEFGTGILRGTKIFIRKLEEPEESEEDDTRYDARDLRFSNEAQALVLLNDITRIPKLLGIRADSESQSNLYMEFIQGISLEKFLDTQHAVQPLTMRTLLRIIVDVKHNYS